MARNNYGFEKRQRELTKEKKKEEKRLRKLERQNVQDPPDGDAEDTAEEAPGQ